MTINTIVSQLKGLGLTNPSADDVAQWCSGIDGELRRLLAEDLTTVAYEVETDGDSDLFVYPPFDLMYFFYCAAQTYFKLRQYADYQNYLEQYNGTYTSFISDWRSRPDYASDSVVTPMAVSRALEARRTSVKAPVANVALWCGTVDRDILDRTCRGHWSTAGLGSDATLLLSGTDMEIYMAYCYGMLSSQESDYTGYQSEMARYNSMKTAYIVRYIRTNIPEEEGNPWQLQQ